MGSKYETLRDEDRVFIQKQKIFFVATAMASGHINLSPKGLDSLRVLNERQLLWLNLTGSGNETAVHLQEDGRITIMFCSFDKQPLIFRVYAQGRAIHRHDDDWGEYQGQFDDSIGARQLILCDIEQVQRSCGFGVPFMTFEGERPTLDQWTEKKGPEGIEDYWRTRNQISFDGLPTKVLPED